MSKKNIILILPPTPFLGSKVNKIPLGVCYVYSTLSRQDFRVRLLDLTECKTWKEIIPQLETTIKGNDIVGFTGTSAHSFFLKKVANIVKKIEPSAKTILGGPAAIAEKDMTQYFDLVFSGHIENVNPDDLIKRTGLFLAPPLPDNIDLIPKPNRKILLYRGGNKLPIITSRFCPFNCTFCFNSLRDKREALKRHSIKRVIEEIEDCLNLGVNNISFQDDTFIISKGWVIDLCKEIYKNSYQLTFDCRARVDMIDKEILIFLRKAGCNSISYGIESGSQKMLNIMNKGTTPELNSFVLKLTKEIGIKTKAYFLLGVPGESVETIYESMKWLEENARYIDKLYLYMWIPYPGSKLYLQKDKTFKIVKNNSNEYNEILGEAMYRSAGENKATITTPTLSAKELEMYFYKIKEDYSDLTKFE